MRGLLVSHSRGLLRFFSSSTRNLFENKVAEKQKLFQENNDLPVHLKGGSRDRLLYSITMAMTVGGTGYTLFFLGCASFPRKNKE
ncbi:cytochrome c oxidase subunit 7A1, mitochondrial-like [Trichosurus vulpecula]|uniref:cytochrome c oxidase subunit 7A1, mitochondrial-like n=1 Tax=Trichosurus vulpecula TaxID=9337 RepID=UPI00186AC4BD|nr:cytochrome c oxidase subunit 7A1, mitochondrial-like [Trichosurus vulpecula]